MIKKISREKCLSTWKKFPYSFNRGDELYYPDIYESYILTIASKSAKGHAKNMAASLHQLVNSLGFSSLIFMGDTKTPWLYQQNEYKPVKEALDFLRVQKVGDNYSGALKVTTESLPAFMIHLFWLVRCNASLPVLDEATDKSFQQVLPQTGLLFFTEGYCYESFGNHRKVSGRMLNM